MKDSDRSRYAVPVATLEAEELQARLKLAMADVQHHFPPGTGVLVCAFDFGGHGKGLGYIANAKREDMIRTLRELISQLSMQGTLS